MNRKKQVNAYNRLDFAFSKEKRVYDCLLEIAVERRNASLALLEWAKVDSNESLRDAISSLYEINRMWSIVQVEFANESKLFQLDLKDILKVEAELDVIQNQIKANTEKKKFIIDSHNIKKMDKSTEIYLYRLEEDIQEANSVLESKKFQAEIRKNTVLRKSLLSVMNSHLKLTRKSESIFLTAIDIIKKISDFPVRFKDPENIIEPQKTGLRTNTEQIKDLANEINIVVQSQKRKSKRVPFSQTEEGFPIYFVPTPKTKPRSKTDSSTLPISSNSNSPTSSTLPKISKALPENESDNYVKANKPRTVSAPDLRKYVPTIGTDDVVKEMQKKLTKYYQSSDSEYEYYLPLHDDDENRSNHISSSESSDDSSYNSPYEVESLNLKDSLKTSSVEKSENLSKREISSPFSIEKSKDLSKGEISLPFEKKESHDLSKWEISSPFDKEESQDKFAFSPISKECKKLSLKRTTRSSSNLSPMSSPKPSPDISPKISPKPSPDIFRKALYDSGPPVKPRPIKPNIESKKDIDNCFSPS